MPGRRSEPQLRVGQHLGAHVLGNGLPRRQQEPRATGQVALDQGRLIAADLRRQREQRTGELGVDQAGLLPVSGAGPLDLDEARPFDRPLRGQLAEPAEASEPIEDDLTRLERRQRRNGGVQLVAAADLRVTEAERGYGELDRHVRSFFHV